MASFLNDQILNAITNSLFRMHDTFSRKIYVFKNPEKTIVATNSNYNGLYKRNTSGSRDNIQNTMIVKEFMARIYYDSENQEYLAAEGLDQKGSQNKIILSKGEVRIVVTVEAYLYIKDARRIDLDGRVFAIKSGGNHSGFPRNQFYHFHLTPIDK